LSLKIDYRGAMSRQGGGFRVAEKRVGQIADSWLELGACADDRRRQSTAVSGR